MKLLLPRSMSRPLAGLRRQVAILSPNSSVASACRRAIRPTANSPSIKAFHTSPHNSASQKPTPQEFFRWTQEQRRKWYHHQQQQQQRQRRGGQYGYDPDAARSARPLFSTSTLKSPSVRYIAIFSSAAAAIFYVVNIEEVPISGRRRFNCYSAASAEKEAATAYRQILEEEGRAGRILPEWDPRVRMVHRVMDRLIEGGNLGTGKAGEGVGWEVQVIDDPGTVNAFVLPGGKVFVYTGILPIARNDSGLAAVLGHEISHNLCGHAAERMSGMVMIRPLIWGLMYFDAIFTGMVGGIGTYFGSMLLDVGVMRPASRQQESEADHVGLLLMAQSCYDPREAIGLWQRMAAAEKAAPPEWMSTHPSVSSGLLFARWVG